MNGPKSRPFVLLILVLNLFLVSPEQVECNQGPPNPPPSAMHNLDEDAMNWGVFCEGSPTWIKENVAAPSLDGNALRCGITGGDPYSNVHCYINLQSEPGTIEFSLALSFWFTATTCNNQDNPSVVQGLEFTMNKWFQSQRYEFALQWQNVGNGAPQWRYWDPHQPEPDRWVPFTPPITQCLQGEQWHTLTMEGELVAGQLHYKKFTIDGQSYILDITVSPLATPGETDRLAIAVQLDGNFAESPYDTFIDQVSFIRTSAVQLYLPLVLK